MRLYVAAILLLAASGMPPSAALGSGKEVLLTISGDNQAAYYHPDQNIWVNTSVMPGPKRILPAATVLFNTVYVCGGRSTGDVTLSTCVKYRPWSDTWQLDKVAPMLSARYDFAMAAAGGKIYAVGGIAGPDEDGSHLFDSYDYTTNAWTQLPVFLKEPLWKPTMVGMGDNLYLVAFNGRTRQPLPTPYQYSTKLAAWIPLQALSPSRAGVALIADERRQLLYAAGGSTQDMLHPVKLVERYNARVEQSPWERPDNGSNPGLQLTSSRTGTPISGVKVEDRLYVVGGALPDAGQIFSGVVEYLNATDGATFRAGSHFVSVAPLAVGVPVVAMAVNIPI